MKNNILNDIYNYKKKEVRNKKELFPIKLLEKSIYFDTKTVSLKTYLKRPDKPGIIAEFKKKSPSAGFINRAVDVEEISLGYMQAGASALSVLTDKNFFAGSLDELKSARKENYCPVLQKDFIIDEYQILEAKSYGADAILLIATILNKQKISELTDFAHSLGLEVICEIHNKEELCKINSDNDIIGVNNRNLKNFKVDYNNSLNILENLPNNTVRISESGIHSVEIAYELLNKGFDGLLIGELFMKSINPVKACKQFIKKLKELN